MLPGNKIRTDQDNLTYRITLNNLPAYQYGPWMKNAIDPASSLISFTPMFEGELQATVTCYDDRGAWGIWEKKIFCVNSGTWLNHPPVKLRTISKPQVVRAGNELTITDIKVIDPDGDELYTSCNIGSIGLTSDGGFIWTFRTFFPGTYNVEIIFYDIRGGYALVKIPVVVKPWWSI